MLLAVNSGDEDAVADWRTQFAKVAPHLEVCWLDDPELRLDQVHYAFVWGPHPGRLAAMRNLRLIVSSGAGVDHITSDPTWPRHVGIVRMGGAETVQRMGEYVCLGALALLRGLPRIIAGQAARRWDSFDSLHTTAETRVGIMGLGNLGAHAAQMLRGLGFQVAGWSRSPKSPPGIEHFVGATERDAFLARTDILVCLLPDTPETRGAIRAETIAKLPRGAGVVNAGRGAHAVLPDIIAALDSGHLNGAVLDVFETEPLPPDHPAWSHPGIIVTPHLASLASRPARAHYVAEAIAAFERGETPPNLYDPARGY